jgi:hypothetical protein
MKVALNESRERARVAATLERYRQAMDSGQVDHVVATVTREGILDFSGRRSTAARVITTAACRPATAGGRTRHVY